MDRKRRLLSPPQGAEDGSGSRVAKLSRGLLVQEILDRVDSREVIAELLKRRPVELEEVQEQQQLIPSHTLLASRLLTNQDKEIKYCLHFQNTLAQELFTYSRIVAADGTKLRIAMMDSNSREVITSGPWSSVKVEIVVVKGDFGGDDKKVWTKEEFNACVVSQRKDKGPLLIGQLEIKLTNGISYLASAKFTDNSSWTKTQKFRLAVKPSPSEHIQERVLEGISEPFRVKDRRVEANRKHHPPLLTDEVWRLKHIMKDRVLHNRLKKGGIHYVWQFLQFFTTDPEGLRSLLGDEVSQRRISDKNWDAIIEHAKECLKGEDPHSYNLAGQHMGDLSASPQDLSIQTGGLPIGSIPMSSTAAFVTPIPQPSPQVPLSPAYPTTHYGKPAAHGDVQGLCQGSYDEQGIHSLQQPVTLQTNGFHRVGISEEDVCGTTSWSSGMIENMDVEKFTATFLEFSEALSPRVVVPTSYRRWVKLLYIVRFFRRTGAVHLKCPNIEPSSSFDAPGADGY